MRTFFLSVVVAMAFATSVAQTVIEIPFVQYPPLTVVAGEVNIALSGSGVTVGSSVSVEGGSGSYTYSWTDESGTVLADTPTYKLTRAGRYYLVVTDGQGCQVSTLFTATGTTGIADGSQPFAADGRDVKQVRVLSESGVLLSVGGSTGVLSSLPQGSYLVVFVYADGKAQARKITINN